MKGECQVVLLTPPGRGAVATLLVSGPLAAEVVSRRFRRDFRQAAIGKILFGKFGDEPSEEIVACRTAEDCVELHCHGGRASAERILTLLAADGCRLVDWSNWQIANEPDEIRREAAQHLASATTERTARILLDQHEGSLRRALDDLTRPKADCRRSSEAAERLRSLLSFASVGLHLVQPWQIALAGRPNVGKSRLMNALLGFRRAIVFDRPGTTRDVVTAATALDGWPVELADTAGLHASDDPLEREGMALAAARLQTADVALLVFDGSQAWDAEDARLLAAWPGAIVVHNKADLGVVEPRPSGLLLSAVVGTGIDELSTAIVRRLVPRAPAPGAAVPFTRRQVDVLERRLAAAEGQAGDDFNCTPRQ